MVNAPIAFDDGQLLCPLCPDGWEYVHVDGVRVSAGGEDGDFNEIAVDAITGQVSTHNAEAAPSGAYVGGGSNAQDLWMAHREYAQGRIFPGD